MDLVKLSEDSHTLLELLADRIPPNDLEACRSFDFAGEWDELIELISAVLVKNDITVTSAERDALAELLHMYPIPIEGYKYINNRDETIAALTVADGQ